MGSQRLFADFCHGWVRSFQVDRDPSDLTEWNELRPGGGIPSLGEDAAGELYILNTDGKAFKIVQR